MRISRERERETGREGKRETIETSQQFEGYKWLMIFDLVIIRVLTQHSKEDNEEKTILVRKK